MYNQLPIKSSGHDERSYGCKYCAFSDYEGRCSVRQESNCSKHHSTRKEFLKEVERLNEIQRHEIFNGKLG